MGQVGIGKMDETNLELMRKYDYTQQRLVLMPLHDYERTGAEEVIDYCCKRYYKLDEFEGEIEWTWMDTYTKVKSALMDGNERLDNYYGENLDWWEERVCNLDNIDDYLGQYLSMRGFLNHVKHRTYFTHLRLSQNAQTMVHAINKLFVHYVEQKVRFEMESLENINKENED